MMGHGPCLLVVFLADVDFLVDNQSGDLLAGVAELQPGFLLINGKAGAAEFCGDAFQKPFMALQKGAVIG